MLYTVYNKPNKHITSLQIKAEFNIKLHLMSFLLGFPDLNYDDERQVVEGHNSLSAH